MTVIPVGSVDWLDGLRWYRRRAVRRDLRFVGRAAHERTPMGPRRIK